MTYRITDSGKLNSVMPDNAEYDLCEPYMTATIVETDGSDLTDAERGAIGDDMRRSCSCARDCCGHYNGGVASITKVWDGRYVVLASYVRNY